MFEFKKTSHQLRQRILFRALVAAVLACVLLGVLGVRLWYLQVVRYEGFAARADQNRIAVIPITPRRGEILDRNGEVLARNYRDYTLSAVPASLGEPVDDML